MSDSDSDSSAEIFSYAKRSFKRKQEVVDDSDDDSDDDSQEDSAPALYSKKKKGLTKSDQKLAHLERQKRNSANKTAKLRAQLEGGDDSDVEILETKSAPAAREQDSLLADSSDEDEVVMISHSTSRPPLMTTSNTATSAYIATTSTVAVAATAAVGRTATTTTSARSREALNTIQKAREAKSRLKMAQNYHAQDVHIPIEIPDESPPAAAAKPAPAPSRVNLGPSIEIKLRVTEMVNGKPTSTVYTEIMSIHMHEPFQKLVERYRTKKGLGLGSNIVFVLDGEKVDFHKTPHFYDMEHGDLIDVRAPRGVAATNGSTPSPSSSAANLGTNLALCLRNASSGDRETIPLKSREPLQKLVDKYKKKTKLAASKRVVLIFDGGEMNLQKSPEFYDMETEDMIDVKVR